MSSVDNKRVVKNAVALTLRTVLATIVGLFTSRIVLKALGVEDYGIYGVIGGVVGMASFLNTAMAGATSRFITFELGHGDENKLKKIFSSSLIIHLVIALVVAVLAETIGLWFVNNKMNFPDGSMPAVNILYQFTILSMIVGFTQVPYSAAIMAHERMNIYAYFEIINAVLKLAIAYTLLAIGNNRLIYYAAMIFAVSTMSAIVYRIYCIRHFSEAKFRFVYDRQILKSMLIFSGFDLYGNMCVVFKSQLQPIFLNIFFGVIANTGANIASTVNGAICGLTLTVAQAFRPQIIKQYSCGDIPQMAKLMCRSTQFTLLAYAIIALPIFFEAEALIQLWLGQVPEYSVEFLRLIIIAVFFNVMQNTNNAAIHATGNIKYISFILGSLFLLSPITAYILLKYVIMKAYVVYATDILFLLIVVSCGFYLVHLQIKNFPIRKYIIPIIKSGITILFSFTVVAIIEPTIASVLPTTSFLNIIIIITTIGCLGFVILITTYFWVALDKCEKQIFIRIVCDKVKPLCK